MWSVAVILILLSVTISVGSEDQIGKFLKSYMIDKTNHHIDQSVKHVEITYQSKKTNHYLDGWLHVKKTDNGNHTPVLIKFTKAVKSVDRIVLTECTIWFIDMPDFQGLQLSDESILELRIASDGGYLPGNLSMKGKNQMTIKVDSK